MTRWASDPEVRVAPAAPTEFDTLVATLGLSAKPALWEHSPQLMRFAERERYRRYVPEKLLRTWALWVDEEDVNCCV